MRRNLLKAALGLAAWPLVSQPALALSPDRPVRIIVPFAPGGGTDLISRTLGTAMAQALGQPVIIENKPGGGTVIGTDLVAKSAPDGHTLVMATFAHAINPSLLPKLPFDTERAFAPVSLIGRGPNVLLVRTDSPWRSVADVLAAARAKPGALTYASQGNGTSAHLAGEMFCNLARVNMQHIPYRGAGPALTDLMGGQVDMMFATAAAASAQIPGGKLRALAVTSPDPAPAFKGVPPVAQSVPDYAVESWYGLFAPAGTPAASIERLLQAVRRSVRAPEFVQKIEAEGLNVVASDPAELARYVKAEEQRWRKIVRENNIKPD